MNYLPHHKVVLCNDFKNNNRNNDFRVMTENANCRENFQQEP